VRPAKARWGMKFAFIQVIPRLVRESQIHTKKEKKEQMLAVDRG